MLHCCCCDVCFVVCFACIKVHLIFMLMSCCAVLRCAVLCCAVLCCAGLCCAVLGYAALPCAVLGYAALPCAVLCRAGLGLAGSCCDLNHVVSPLRALSSWHAPQLQQQLKETLRTLLCIVVVHPSGIDLVRHLSWRTHPCCMMMSTHA